MPTRLINLLGLTVLLAAFLVAALHVATRTAQDVDPRTITIRFSHWQLEGGLREAFDEVGREYTRLHPHVRIVQLAVPGQVYGTYQRTQLTGDEPPDLMELGDMPADWLSRYFTPITAWVERPNPYNRGTDLETLPWRDTFLDGLASAPGLETMLDYYSVPNTVVTARMYYNRDLYRKIMGHEQTPQTYEEFLALCAKTHEYAQRTGETLMPVAGSRFNANILLDRLFRSQTQKLSLERDPLRALNPPGALAFLNGRTTLDDPALRNGMELMREVAKEMPPGFLQFDRDQAIFHFAQGRALMIATGSWDFRSIESQSPFALGIFPIPLPSRQNAKYGPFLLGSASEAGGGLAGHLFLSARSRHPETAIDFLQFMTSRKGNQMFVNRSRWLPAVVGVTTPEVVRAFAPVTTGYPDGFVIAMIMWGSGEMFRIQSNHLHFLVDPNGSVDQFVAAMKPELNQAIRADLLLLAKDYNETVRRQDTTFFALHHAGPPQERAKRLAALLETQDHQEIMWHWLHYELNQTTPPSSSEKAKP